MNAARRSRLGLLIATAYVVTAATTMQLTSHHVRPLFEGFTPPPPYQWVKPPPEFRASNQLPTIGYGNIDIGPNGSAPGFVNTDDGQASLNLPENAFAPHGTDTSVRLEVTPLDPAKLGALPPRLAADGNAYRIAATFQPSRRSTGKLAVPGNVFLVVPQRATAFLFSPDGKAWQRLALQQAGGSGEVAAVFDQPGYFLGAMPPVARTSGSTSAARVVLIAALTVVIAVALLLGPWSRLRHRPVPSRAGQRRPTGKGSRNGRRTKP